MIPMSFITLFQECIEEGGEVEEGRGEGGGIGEEVKGMLSALEEDRVVSMLQCFSKRLATLTADWIRVG